MGTPVSVVSLPQSIGILDATGKIIPIIVANSPLPIKRKKTFMVKNEVAKPLSISIQGKSPFFLFFPTFFFGFMISKIK